MPTFGDTSAGGDEFPMADGRCLVDRFNCPDNAEVTLASAYRGASSTAGASWKFVILDDAAGAPGNVLYVSNAVAAASGAGWTDFTFSGTPTLAPGDYWLGIVANSFQAYAGEDASGVSPDVCMANGTFDYASPPASWPGTDGSYGVGLDVYVTYDVAGSGVVRRMTLLGVG